MFFKEICEEEFLKLRKEDGGSYSYKGFFEDDIMPELLSFYLKTKIYKKYYQCTITYSMYLIKYKNKYYYETTYYYSQEDKFFYQRFLNFIKENNLQNKSPEEALILYALAKE